MLANRKLLGQSSSGRISILSAHGMTTIESKTFGSARSVFERNNSRDKPPPSPKALRSSAPPFSSSSSPSVGKLSLRRESLQTQLKPPQNAVKRLYPSLSSPRTQQLAVEVPVTETATNTTETHFHGFQDLPSSLSPNRNNNAQKKRYPEWKPRKLQVHHAYHPSYERAENAGLPPERDALGPEIGQSTNKQGESVDSRNKHHHSFPSIGKKAPIELRSPNLLSEEKSRRKLPQIANPDFDKAIVDNSFTRRDECGKEKSKNDQSSETKLKTVDSTRKAVVKVQALARGYRQRTTFASLVERNRMETELQQRIVDIREGVNKELLKIMESVENYKEELRSKLNQRREKHQDKVESYERNKLEVEHLKKDNAKFRSRNEVLMENCRKLRLKNLRLEKSSSSHNEQMAQIQSHYKQCKEDSERLLEVQASYQKNVDQLQSSLETRTAYAVFENKLKQRFRKAIEDYMKMVERSRDHNNEELISTLCRMRDEGKKHDKTSNDPCPYEDVLRDGGDPDREDSCSSLLHSPPRIGYRSPVPSNCSTSQIAPLPIVSCSSDDDSYVFEDKSTHSRCKKSQPVAHKKVHSATGDRDRSTTSTYTVSAHSQDRDKSLWSPPSKTRKAGPSTTRSPVKGEDAGNSFGSNKSNRDPGADLRNGTHLYKSRMSSNVMPNGKSTENQSVRRKPTKFPQLRPTAKQSSIREREASMTSPTKDSVTRVGTASVERGHNEQSENAYSNRRSRRGRRIEGDGSDSVESDDSDESNNTTKSDDSSREIDRSYTTSIAKAASILGGSTTPMPQISKSTSQTEPNDDSAGWSTGDSNSDSED